MIIVNSMRFNDANIINLYIYPGVKDCTYQYNPKAISIKQLINIKVNFNAVTHTQETTNDYLGREYLGFFSVCCSKYLKEICQNFEDIKCILYQFIFLTFVSIPIVFIHF